MKDVGEDTGGAVDGCGQKSDGSFVEDGSESSVGDVKGDWTPVFIIKERERNDD